MAVFKTAIFLRTRIFTFFTSALKSRLFKVSSNDVLNTIEKCPSHCFWKFRRKFVKFQIWRQKWELSFEPAKSRNIPKSRKFCHKFQIYDS